MDKTSDKYYALCICLVLVLATGAVYWQVRGHEFVSLDDKAYISENEHVLNGLTWDSVKWAFTTNTMGNWHPLTWLSLMLDCQLTSQPASQQGGRSGLFDSPARACHTTNLMFHIANTLLLFAVFKRMTGSVWPSAFVSAFFALHPLHVESVLVRQGRSDEAVEHYKQALKIEPGYRDAIVNLGIVLINKGQVDEAIRYYRDFLQQSPQDYLIHKNLGDALLLREKTDAYSDMRMTPAMKENLEEAVKHYKQALQIKPDFAEAQSNLKRAQTLLSKFGKVK